MKEKTNVKEMLNQIGQKDIEKAKRFLDNKNKSPIVYTQNGYCQNCGKPIVSEYFCSRRCKDIKER